MIALTQAVHSLKPAQIASPKVKDGRRNAETHHQAQFNDTHSTVRLRLSKTESELRATHWCVFETIELLPGPEMPTPNGVTKRGRRHEEKAYLKSSTGNCRASVLIMMRYTEKSIETKVEQPNSVLPS